MRTVGLANPFLVGAVFAGEIFPYPVEKVQEFSVWATAEKTLPGRQLPLPFAGIRVHERHLVHA